jgi:hypothetical protein
VHPTRPHSLIRAIAWAVCAPFIAIAGLALFVFGFGVLAVAVQLVAAMLKHAGV